MKTNTIINIAIAILLTACQNDDDKTLKAEDYEHLSGGQSTVNDQSRQAFSLPSPSLTNQEQLLFGVGNSFFNQNWVQAPASTKARDGLGPIFNARSCAGCHFKDGRGRTPAFDGETSHGLLLRLSVPGTGNTGGPKPDPNYGGQLQDMAISTYQKEGDFSITYQEIENTYNDGTTYKLRKPTYTFQNLSKGAMDASIMISPRVAPQMIGMGLLEAIDPADILANADENDIDGDGISGKPNYVWDVEANKLTLGRLGWKANEPTIKQQVAGAFLGDMGITTSMFSSENCIHGCDSIPNGGTPEIDDDDLNKVVLYSASLAVPVRRDYNDEVVLSGKELFFEIGCNKCHVQKYTTGTHPDFEAFSNQLIYPYTDLLLHDMGDDLADNRPDFDANGNEWRTPPLWGIGLFQTVNGHTEYLHDGRARNLEEAILWHGGEAESTKQLFTELSLAERNALIKFLNSL